MPPLQVFKIFDAPPPPPEFGIEGVQSGILSYHRYNLHYFKMSDILKHVLLKTEIGFEYNHQGRSKASDVWGGGMLEDYTCNNYNKAFCD